MTTNSPHGRQKGETWTEWAKRSLETTRKELGMNVTEWEAAHDTTWPGDGYRRTLESQAKHLVKLIAEYGDKPGNNVPL